MKKPFILLLLLNFYKLSFATSTPYRGGEVAIDIKNNMPCFYINDIDKSGVFNIVILNLSEGGMSSWHYENFYEKNYPKKDNCIALNNKNFKNFSQLKNNTPYSVTLGDIKTAYNTNFCITEKNGKSQIQNYIGTKCIDKEVRGIWEKLKNWFIELFKSLNRTNINKYLESMN